eukprot:6198070-Pleurochrysis_carterae.AAC.1
MHESANIYSEEGHALTTGKCVHTATRRGSGRLNSGVSACEHACEICARTSAVLRQRNARSMRDWRTIVAMVKN